MLLPVGDNRLRRFLPHTVELSEFLGRRRVDGYAARAGCCVSRHVCAGHRSGDGDGDLGAVDKLLSLVDGEQVGLRQGLSLRQRVGDAGARGKGGEPRPAAPTTDTTTSEAGVEVSTVGSAA